MYNIMSLSPPHNDEQRLRKRYGNHRDSLFTFLDHPELAPDNNSSERALRPTATYRKVTGGFRSVWGSELYSAARSIIGTAARQATNAFAAIKSTLGISTACPLG
jgi:transposase